MIIDMKLELEIDIDWPDKNDKQDMCECSDCGWKGKVSECEVVEESDGWASYLVHACPVCEDGGYVDHYFYSGEVSDVLI